MSSLGEWLAGLIESLSTETDWATKTPSQQAADLRFAVVSRISIMRADDDILLKTYFHFSDGTWEALLAAVVKAYPPTDSKDAH
jgi:hypothetical protein